MKTPIITFLLLLSCTAMMLAQGQATKLDPAEYRKKTEGKNVQLVDIRSPQEYANGHITNAENQNFYSATFYSDLDKYNKSQPLYIYCRSGNRTSLAINELQKIGFVQVIDLKTGLNGWIQANYTVVK